MSRYNTGIGDNIPSLFDLASAFSGFVTDFAQLMLGSAHTSFKPACVEDSDPGVYDPVTHSWSGTDGMRYRVPLYPIPSERHAREKSRNVKLLMDNCRRICVNDELPSTSEEMKFWVSYRFMKYQLYFGPCCVIVPPIYVFCKVFQDKIPRILRGRTMPLLSV
ncbi:hypothetical protein STCU_09603 [Strigomonas culicis]|uniref:Uncharacterized protein n=1 Tax=Strigomonas culicis TaxID=28005 RepID=S9UXB3_9TRYP|nr:hypothetical protein STCU_09603 [Strigomonas culicis]|eukprot:EPY19131.1 hypothetical protein STCU_09603 [Strigomonas culicis]